MLCAVRCDTSFYRQICRAKSISAFAHIIEVGDIGHHSRVYLHLHIIDRRYICFLLNVSVFKVYTRHITLRNHESPEQKAAGSNQCSRNHVRAKQTAKTHTRAFHRYDFGIIGQFRGKENDGNKHEQRCKQVYKVRHKVNIVIKMIF